MSRDHQRALLEQLSGGAAPLRSLRQVGWPLGPKEVLGLWHEQLSQANNTNVYVTPFVLPSLFQSAVSLATMVEEYVEKGKGMAQVEQELLTVSGEGRQRAVQRQRSSREAE